MTERSNRRAQIQRASDQLFHVLEGFLRRSDGLAVVKAPPGSGKTFLLLRLTAAAFADGARIAIATQTNAQADDVARRLAADHPAVPVTRFAAGRMHEEYLGASVTWAWSDDQLPVGSCAVVATTAKWSLTGISETFDLLLVDEAWQMSWADFMLCSKIAGRFILIGDPGQIPPVVSIPVERWETSPRAPHQPAPELLLADPNVNALSLGLPSCRRLPADAVELVRPFYDFEFDAWADTGDRGVKAGLAGDRDGIDGVIDLLRSRSVAALTMPTPVEGPPLELDDGLAKAAAAVSARLLERGARAAADDDGGYRKLKPSDIGIAATHRVLNSAINQSLPRALRDPIRVDTPERWQGLERKVMIVVHPLSGVVHPSSFDLETGRLCVMASRHRAGLVIISRDHVKATLETHIPVAEQAVGRPDVTGRGHQQHLRLWESLQSAGGVVRM